MIKKCCFVYVMAAWAALPAMVRARDHDLVISAYQGPCRGGDFQANREVARRVIAEALARGSHFLAFPETFLSGYDTPDLVQAGARALDDPEVVEFIAESSGHQMVILIGLARRTPEGLYNSILVIQSGRLLGAYDKVMLTTGDRDRLGFSPGKSVPVFDAHSIRFGVIVCHDSSFPYPALSTRLKGAQLLFSPHYNSIPSNAMDDHRRSVRNCHIGLAAQLKMAVVRANAVVTDKPDAPGYGDSFILAPNGEPLAEARLFRTELITAKLTPAHFKAPVVWADLNQTPEWLRHEIAELLTNPPPTP